jgi:hypothetical protein
MITDLGGIRLINTILQIAILILVCYLLIAGGYKVYVLPYVMSYMMLRPVAISRCLQFSTCYYIFSVAIIVLLIKARNERLHDSAWLVFLYAGIATAYLDYLTYPITTFGIPMVVFVLCNKGADIRKRLMDVFRYGIIWGAGYGVMWALKWIIASILTNENVIADAMRAISERTSTAGRSVDEHFSMASSVIWNLKAFVYTPVTLLVFVFVVTAIVIGIRSKRVTVKRAVMLLPYLIVALLPVIWFAATTNHSCFHTFFTNKGYVVSLMAMLFGITSVCLEETEQSYGKTTF